jgi:hypothetical protein
VRRAAAFALSERGDAAVVPPLVSALNDPDPQTRVAAAQALGNLGEVAGFAPLMAALSDANIEVRSTAAQALGKIGGDEAVAPLIAALGERSFTTSFLLWALRCELWGLRVAAAHVLGRDGSGQEVAALTDALEDARPAVRNAAAQALRNLETRVGALRASSAEQEKVKRGLQRLAAVDVERWVPVNGTRYGPLTPGDDTAVESIFTDADQVVRFLVQTEPELYLRWGLKEDALIVEYAPPDNGRLNSRLVVLKRERTGDFLCYLAWALAQ